MPEEKKTIQTRGDGVIRNTPAKRGTGPSHFAGKEGQGTHYCRGDGFEYWSKFGPKSNQDKPCPKATPSPAPTPTPTPPPDKEKTGYDAKKGSY